MATKLENIELEIAHFDHFKKYINGLEGLCTETVDELLKAGFIQVSTAFEHALADVGGYTVVSEDKNDLSDGSEGKLASARTYGYGKSYGAPVTNVSGKTGTLRVQVYERKQNKFYYFAIPRRAYSHIPKTSNIEIPFELNGDPRTVNRSVVNWWDFEEKSFEDMCKRQFRIS